MKVPSLLRSLVSFSGMTFISRLLGLAREVAMSAAFGAGMVTDAFNVAFRIPNFLRRLFAEGSFSLAFVPVLTEVKEKESEEALRELVARTAGTLGAILLVVTAVGVIGADWVVRLFAEKRRYLHNPRSRQCTLCSLTSFGFDGDELVSVAYSEPAGDLIPAGARKDPFSAGGGDQ